jgi:hypothetical protein
MVDRLRRGLPSELAAMYAQKTPPVRESPTQGFSSMGQQKPPGTFRALGERNILTTPASTGGFRTLTGEHTTGALRKGDPSAPLSGQKQTPVQNGGEGGSIGGQQQEQGRGEDASHPDASGAGGNGIVAPNTGNKEEGSRRSLDRAVVKEGEGRAIPRGERPQAQPLELGGDIVDADELGARAAAVRPTAAHIREGERNSLQLGTGGEEDLGGQREEGPPPLDGQASTLATSRGPATELRVRGDTTVLVEGGVQVLAQAREDQGRRRQEGQVKAGLDAEAATAGAGGPGRPGGKPPLAAGFPEEFRSNDGEHTDEPRLILHRGPRPRLTEDQVRMSFEYMRGGHTVNELVSDARFASTDELGTESWQNAIDDSAGNIEDLLVACSTGDLLNQIGRYKTNPLTFGMKMKDLYIAGQLGLREAIQTFDPDHPSESGIVGTVPLMGYASYKIRHHVRTAIAQEHDISHYQLSRYNIAIQISYAFFGEYSQDLTKAGLEQQLLYHTKFSANAIQWILDFKETHSLLSLNRAIGESTTEHGDQAPATVLAELTDQDELSVQREAIAASFRHLDPLARDMILDDTGMNESGTPLTTAEMAVKYGSPEEQVTAMLAQSYALLRGVDELAPLARGRVEQVPQQQQSEQFTLLNRADQAYVESVLEEHPSMTKTEQIQLLSSYLTAEQLARHFGWRPGNVTQIQRRLVERGELDEQHIQREINPLSDEEGAYVQGVLAVQHPSMTKTEQIQLLSSYLTAEQLAQRLGMYPTHVRAAQQRLVVRGELRGEDIRQETPLDETVRRVLAEPVMTKTQQIQLLSPYLTEEQLAIRLDMTPANVRGAQKRLVVRGELREEDVQRMTPLSRTDRVYVARVLAATTLEDQIRRLSHLVRPSELVRCLGMNAPNVRRIQRRLIEQGQLRDEDIKRDSSSLNEVAEAYVVSVLAETVMTKTGQIRDLSSLLTPEQLAQRLKMRKDNIVAAQRLLVERDDLREEDIRQDPPLSRYDQELVQRVLSATTRQDQIRRLSHHLPLEELARGLRVDKGHVWKTQCILVERGELREEDIRRGRPQLWVGKEEEIIQLMGLGRKYREIGTELGLSRNAVQRAVIYLREIGRLEKLNRLRADRIVEGGAPTKQIAKVGRRLERDQRVTYWREGVQMWEERHGTTGLLTETEETQNETQP